MPLVVAVALSDAHICMLIDIQSEAHAKNGNGELSIFNGNVEVIGHSSAFDVILASSMIAVKSSGSTFVGRSFTRADVCVCCLQA